MLLNGDKLQLNEYKTVPFYLRFKPNFDCDSFLIYTFCANCLDLPNWQLAEQFQVCNLYKHVNQQMIVIKFWIEERMELSSIYLVVLINFMPTIIKISLSLKGRCTMKIYYVW